MLRTAKKALLTSVFLAGAFLPFTTFAQTINDSDTGGGVSVSALKNTSAQTVTASEIQLQARENARDASLQQSLGNGNVTDPGVAAAAPSGTFSAPGTAPSLSSSGAQATKDLNLASVDLCSISFTGTFQPLNCLGYGLLKIGGWVATVGGVFLNLSIDFTVLKMSTVINGTGAINAAWKVFRDLSNIFFIFILIYIAISTIIGTAGGQTKKMLINVIIVALLINFSMFFTKVAVDTSNILTIQFFNSISKGDNSWDNGLSWVFMNASRLTTIYQAGNTIATSPNGKAFLSYNFLIVGIMGLAFALVLAFVFMAIAIMFISRFVTIIFLIVLSPLAFMGFAVSKLSGKWHQWLSVLTEQIFFAPVMMAMLWTVAVIINSDGFRAAVAFSDPANNFADLFTLSSVTGSIYIVLNFSLLVALLIGGLLISKNFSHTSANFAMKLAGGASFGAAAWIGRKTGGWAGNKLAKSERLQKFAANNPTVGMFALKAVKGVASASFDARNIPHASDYLGKGPGTGGYVGELEAQVKKRQEDAKLLKDLKLYQDSKTEGEAKAHKETVEEKDKKVVELNKQMANFIAAGNNLNDTRYKEFEREKAEAVKARDEAKKKLETLNKDQTKTQTGEQTYAKNLTKGTIAAIMTRLAAEREKSQEKIEESYTKDRQKKDSEWAKEFNLKEINRQIASLDAEIESLGSSVLNVTEEVKNWNEQIAKNNKEIEKITLDQKNNPNVDIIASNKRRKIIAEENGKIQESINAVKANESTIAEQKKIRLIAEREKLINQRKEIQNKKDRDALLKTLVDATKPEEAQGEEKKGEDKPKKDDAH